MGDTQISMSALASKTPTMPSQWLVSILINNSANERYECEAGDGRNQRLGDTNARIGELRDYSG